VSLAVLLQAERENSSRFSVRNVALALKINPSGPLQEQVEVDQRLPAVG